MSQTPNRLITATSPYLLQHAYNPVDWFPWGNEAFQKAADENKLVLISIGYSACHWCHVMEREVFEKPEAAAFMNEHFVCIKVDREERPDVDHTYMDAAHIMGQRGGWPLNVFALSDGRPIYCGTYFPLEKWLSILENLIDLQRNEHSKILDYAKAVEEGLIQIDLIPKQDNFIPSTEKFNSLYEGWKNYLDDEKGGSRRAPKFPMPSHLLLLLHYSPKNDREYYQNYLRVTLDQMALGGIYDQIEGGFSRYSVDDIWKVPHFEKMLYDNAQLMEVYAKASQKFSSSFYNQIATTTADFVLANWKNDEGLIQSASDADSEGVEGKYYVWSLEELKQILKDDFQMASEIFFLNEHGKWEDNFILMRRDIDTETCRRLQLTEEELQILINRINVRLVTERKKRIPPGIDTKTLTSWNSMFVCGLLATYMSSNNEKYLEEAIRLIENISKKMWTGDVLLRVNDSQQKIYGFLEDYAFFIKAIIELFGITGNETYAHLANEVTKKALSLFEDKNGHLLWFSQRDPLTISRKKEVIDNVIPSSNAVMAENLFLLGSIFGDAAYELKSEGMLAEVNNQIDHASSYTYWLKIQNWHLHGFKEIVITGLESKDWSRKLSQHFLPSSLVIYSTMKSSLPILKDRFLEQTAAYVCTNKTCSLPFFTFDDLWKNLK